MVRKYIEDFGKVVIGLIVCDEGHRLKNATGNQTIKALKAIRCSKKIILTGTPVQNNLSELFAMCDFVNPNCLGPLPTFRNTLARPIEKAKGRLLLQKKKKYRLAWPLV
eukprot:TRINITY_DN1381_c0_g1_i1.p2 TRINITY_DN1381_c0_g1~~TRINITY_DN1381_c0_g1_i1.p2  ORF type:complete len:109 (+),score=27.23 TRINITY_DN1381_c0_g1_i1:1314-1640(+)